MCGFRGSATFRFSDKSGLRGFVSTDSHKLLQFRVLGLGLLQDADVGVGVFPVQKDFEELRSVH